MEEEFVQLCFKSGMSECKIHHITSPMREAVLSSMTRWVNDKRLEAVKAPADGILLFDVTLARNLPRVEQCMHALREILLGVGDSVRCPKAREYLDPQRAGSSMTYATSEMLVWEILKEIPEVLQRVTVRVLFSEEALQTARDAGWYVHERNRVSLERAGSWVISHPGQPPPSGENALEETNRILDAITWEMVLDDGSAEAAADLAAMRCCRLCLLLFTCTIRALELTRRSVDSGVSQVAAGAGELHPGVLQVC